MKKINLRDYYPFYKKDFFIEVDNQIAEILSSIFKSQTISDIFADIKPITLSM